MADHYKTESGTSRASSRSDLCVRKGSSLGRRVGPSFSMAVFVAALLCCCTAVVGLQNQMDGTDIQTFLNALQNPDVAEIAAAEKASQEGLSSSWGIADQKATVGKLFRYQLPAEVLQGNYEVQELGKGSLPGWLALDSSTGLLQGVPGAEQKDQDIFLEVTTPSADGASQDSDVFSIKVQEDSVHVDSAAAQMAETEGIRPIKCPQGSSVTVATVIVDVDLGAMMPREKVNLMLGMCSHLKLPEDVLRVVPVGDKPMFDGSALVAGPGDVKQAQRPGAMIQWEVGCGNVHARHMPILQQLEATSSDGSMGHAIDGGVVGWHVTNSKPHSPIRLKREVPVQPTPTPTPTGVPPSQRPIPTMTSRIQPTHTHKEHRTKTKGRHRHKTKHPKHTKKPKPRKSRKGKKLRKTKETTSTPLPIEPTRTVDVVPTETMPTPTSSPGVSRTIDVIEPSMQPTKTWSSQPTEELPSTSPLLPSATDQPKPTEAVTQVPPSELPPDGTPQPTEAVSPGSGSSNFEPILIQDIKRHEVQVGEVLNFKVPSNTFHDKEDGNTENLKLFLQAIDGLGLPRDSWLKFNSTSQTLYGLPMHTHIGRQEYAIVAIDSGGKIARDPFEIVVVRRAHNRRINHEFTMTLDTDFDEFSVSVDNRIEIAQKIAMLYGDADMKKITVTRIARGSVVFAWTNNSVPLEAGCPVEAITRLLEYLITENNTLNKSFVEVMKPYKILKVGAAPRGVCDISTPTPKATDPVVVEPRETSNEDILITTVVPAVVIAAMLLVAGCIACFLYRKKRKGKLSDEDQQTFINKGIPIIFADELEEKPDPPSRPLIMSEEKPPVAPPDYQRSVGGSIMSTPPSDHKEPLIDTEEEIDDDSLLASPYRPPPPVASGSQGHRHARHSAQQVAYRQPPPYVPP